MRGDQSIEWIAHTSAQNNSFRNRIEHNKFSKATLGAHPLGAKIRRASYHPVEGVSHGLIRVRCIPSPSLSSTHNLTKFLRERLPRGRALKYLCVQFCTGV